MARIRNVKPDWFKDEDLTDLPPVYRLLLLGMNGQADARGIFVYRPKRLMIEVLPFDGIPGPDVDRMVQILEGTQLEEELHGTRGFGVRFVERWKEGETTYLRLLSFNDLTTAFGQRPSKDEWESLADAILEERAHPLPHGEPPTEGWSWDRWLDIPLQKRKAPKKRASRRKRATPGGDPGGAGGGDPGGPPGCPEGGDPGGTHPSTAGVTVGVPTGSGTPGRGTGKGTGTGPGRESERDPGIRKGDPGGVGSPHCPQGFPQGPPKDEWDELARSFALELIRLARKHGRSFTGPWPHPNTLEAVTKIQTGGWTAFCNLQERSVGRIAHLIGLKLVHHYGAEP